ncbi:hypothetical protein AVEN_77866-1, partial [Araneus ventricosus]
PYAHAWLLFRQSSFHGVVGLISPMRYFERAALRSLSHDTASPSPSPSDDMLSEHTFDPQIFVFFTIRLHVIQKE